MINWIAGNFINIIIFGTILQVIIESVYLVNNWRPRANKTELINGSILRIIAAPFGWGFLLFLILFSWSGDYDV